MLNSAWVRSIPVILINDTFVLICPVTHIYNSTHRGYKYLGIIWFSQSLI